MRKRILAILMGLLIIPTMVNAETKFQDSTGYYIEDINHLYPETGIVTKVEIVNDNLYLLTITVANGNIFQCETVDCDWYKNDFASMLMDGKGTDIVYDDEIIKCQYSGVIEHFEVYAAEN